MQAMGTATGDRRIARSRPAVGAGERRVPLGDRAPEIVLGIAMVVWAVTFSVLVYLKHDRFASVDFGALTTKSPEK